MPRAVIRTADFVVLQRLVQRGLADVDDLAAQRQNRLVPPVPALLGAVMNEHAARQREVMRSRNFQIIDIYLLFQTLHGNDAMIVICDGLAGTGRIAVKVASAEGVKAQQ